jgi:protein-disulfide isomerase
VREGIATGTPSRLPAGATPEGGGILLGSGALGVDVYIDFQCPFCKRFEALAAGMLGRLLRDGAIGLVYHPVAFLDRLSTTSYSSRASAASGCASDSRRFAAYKDALFANQPPEGGPGLSDHELIQVGRMVGLNVPALSSCVARGTYLPWAAFVTEAAVERGVNGTPSVFVAGVPVAADPITIAAAVADLAP